MSTNTEADTEATAATTPTRIFSTFGAQISHLDKSLEGLHVLMERIRKNAAAFDEEDQSIIQSRIDQYEQEKIALQQELSRRETLYHSTVKRMEQALHVRMEVLQHTDSETGVLEAHPDLMDMFVQKQTKLTEMLQTVKDKLAMPVASSSSAEE